MHRDVDLTGQKVIFDFAGEKPLAADLFQRPVNDPVAGGLDDDDGERLERQVERAGKTLTGLVGLCQGKR